MFARSHEDILLVRRSYDEQMKFSLRPAEKGDLRMLYELHAASMREAVAATWGWDESWQEEYFRHRFCPSRVTIVAVNGEAIGMMEVEERCQDIYLHNLEFFPRFQERGVGSEILRRLIAKARNRGVPLRLQVLRANPRARRLYERLGFVETDSNSTHFHMEYRPR